ncbi:hypothetical protein ABPG72_000210 [Tetrahymena utriculariae]
MKGEITIQKQQLPNNLQIICRIHNKFKRQIKEQRNEKNAKRCNYKEYLKVKYNSKAMCNYRIIQSFQAQFLKQEDDSKSRMNNTITSQVSEQNKYLEQIQNETISQNSSNNEQNSLQQSKPQKKNSKETRSEDPQFQILLNEYKSLYQQNCMKNIKNGFFKYILNNVKQEKAKQLEQVVENKVNYQWIKRKIKNLKNIQDNKAIKIICKHPITKAIFKDFLLNHDSDWLQSSRIKVKEYYIQFAAFLIKLIEQIDYIDVIQNYQKNKQNCYLAYF